MGSGRPPVPVCWPPGRLCDPPEPVTPPTTPSRARSRARPPDPPREPLGRPRPGRCAMLDHGLAAAAAPARLLSADARTRRPGHPRYPSPRQPPPPPRPRPRRRTRSRHPRRRHHQLRRHPPPPSHSSPTAEAGTRPATFSAFGASGEIIASRCCKLMAVQNIVRRTILPENYRRSRSGNPKEPHPSPRACYSPGHENPTPNRLPFFPHPMHLWRFVK